MAEQLGVQRRMASAPAIDNRALRQSQRTELVSELAGAIANQFNNIMMSITSYAELELKKASGTQKRSLEQMLANSARATSLIQAFLAFSRHNDPAPRSQSLNQVVEEICHLLEPLVGEGISLSVNLDPAAGSIEADPIEIEQLILILGVNAREQLVNGGTLGISTEFVHLEPSVGDEIREAGPYSVLTIQYVAKVTSNTATKTPDQDMQLTRAIAAIRSIVRERGGHLRVTSRPGQGTSFRAYFPSVTEDIPQFQAAAQHPAAPSTKTVLIVEDDDAVRNPASEFLKMEGFKVLQARTGPEALRIVQESRSQLDLLITDMVMSGMHGTKVAEELSRTHPGLKVLFISGDAHEAAKATNANTSGRPHLLQKPFRLNKLSDKINELLGE